MWINPSEENEKRRTTLPVHRRTKQLVSSQPKSRVALQTWEATNVAAKFHLLFVHGALAYSGRHAPMFEWMIRQLGGQLKIHALDIVGHGVSTGPRAHVDSFSVYTADFLQAMKVLREEYPQGEFVLMGHSLGGLIVLKTLLEEEQSLPFWPKGMVLSNPCIRPLQVVDFPKIHELLATLSQRFPQMRLPRVLKGRDVARDAEAANQFETDPLIPHFLTARMAREVWLASEGVRALSYFVKVPVLFLVSDEDKVVDREATLLFARGIDKKWAKVEKYSNCGHELLHENIRQKVWRDIIDWLGTLGESA